MPPQKRKDHLPSLQSALEELRAGRPTPQILETYQQPILQKLSEAASNDGSLEAIRSALDKATQAAELVAELAKEERSRTSFGTLRAVSQLVSILDTASAFSTTNEADSAMVEECRIQILRAIGNLCYDHEANRVLALEADGVRACLACVTNAKPGSKTARTACGAMINMSDGSADVKSAMLKASGISILLQLLHVHWLRKDPLALSFAARLLAALVEEASVVPQLVAIPSALSQLVELVETASADIGADFSNIEKGLFDALEPLIEILEVIVRDTEPMQRAVVVDGYLEIFLKFLEKQPVIADETANDKQEIAKHLAQRWKDLKSNMLRVVVSVTLSDANMNTLFESNAFITRMCDWLSNAALPANKDLDEQDELVACAALCIGNLARTENHCLLLVNKHHVVEPVVKLLKKYAPTEGISSLESNPMVKAKVRHACVGLLKNLAIPVSNKQILGDQGVIAVVAPLIDSSLQQIQQAVVGLLKHLCNGSQTNALRMMEGEDPTPLQRLAKVAKSTDDPGVKGEGTRALINLVKEGWRMQAGQENEQESIAAKKLRLQAALLAENIVSPIVAMACEAKYPILQNEAVIAMTIILTSATAEMRGSEVDVILKAFSKSDPNTAGSEGTIISPAVAAEKKQVETPKHSEQLSTALVNILANSSSRYPEQMRLNVLTLLGRVFAAAKAMSESCVTRDDKKPDQTASNRNDLSAALPPTTQVDKSAAANTPGSVQRSSAETAAERIKKTQGLGRDFEDILRILTGKESQGIISPQLLQAATEVMRMRDAYRL